MEDINDQLYAADAAVADAVEECDTAKNAVERIKELRDVAEAMQLDALKSTGEKMTDNVAKAKAKVYADAKYREQLEGSQQSLIGARKALALAKAKQDFLGREFDTLRKDADFERDAMARSPR